MKIVTLFGLYVVYLLVMTWVFQSQERNNEIKECKMAQDKVKKYKVSFKGTVHRCKRFMIS